MSTNSSYALQQMIYGDTTVNIDTKGLWNATALVQAYNKRHNKQKQLSKWLALDSTKELMSEVVKSVGIKVLTGTESDFQDLVNVIQGGVPELQGTWIHPKLVLPLAHWLSPSFYIWCNDKLEEVFLKEKQDLTKQLLLLKPLQPLLQQPAEEEQVQILLEKSFGGGHRRFACGIPDIVSDKFLIEIKDAPNWKDCLGQLQSYRYEMMESGDFNNRVCVGYFFDRNNWLTDSRKKMILDHFHNLDLEVIWHCTIDEDTTLSEQHIEAQKILQSFLQDRERREARYLCIAPDGTESYTSALKAYCKERNLDYSSAMKCLKNTLQTVKGYRFEYASEEAANESLIDKKKRAAEREPIIAQNIEGTKTFIIKNVHEFVRMRGIKSPGNIYAVLNKKEVRGSIRQTAYGYRYWWSKSAPPEIVMQLDLE